MEEEILFLQNEAKKGPISVEKILLTLSGKGLFLMVILLSIPFCQPIQIPGFSTPFGIVIALLGLRIGFMKKIWLPKKILSKSISSSTVHTITSKTLWLIHKMKRWVHPRFEWICHHKGMRLLNSLIIFSLGVFLALPLPIPFSNLSAAWALFLLSLGVIEDDGLFVLIGYLLALLTLGILLALLLSLKLFF